MSEKKMVRRSVAITLGIICILLIAVIAYFSIIGISAQNSYNNLQNQNKQLQMWLDGNETLLSQTQANNTNLQNQIDSLDSKATKLQNQVAFDNVTITNLQKIANLTGSTVIVQHYLVGFTPLSPIVVVSNNTVLPSNVVYWNDSSFNQIPSYHVDIDHAGYIVVNATPSNSVVELEYSSNGLSYNNTVNLGNNTISVFPVLPTSTLTILVGSNYSSFPLIMAETVTITYYY
jgi:cell division protein FtsB